MKKKNHIVFLIFIVILLIAALFFYYLTRLSDFPFISMKYVYDKKEFNSPESLNYNLMISKFSADYIKNYFQKLNLNYANEYEIIYAIVKFVRKHLKPEYNDISNIDAVFKNRDSEYDAICSGYSQLVCAAAQTLGFKSRTIWMQGHTVAEIYFSKSGWVMVDSNGNLIFRNKINNLFASCVDLITDFDSYIPFRIDETINGNDYDYISMNETEVFKNNKTAVIIESRSLLSFTSDSRNPLKIVKYLIGHNIAEGMQFVSHNSKKYGNQRFNVVFFFGVETILFVIVFFILFWKPRRNESDRF
ncbi:MAG TPA: transglutaminase-like domain-containing protein [bacterium]|nr:transglutaminase-like domain-containing protein [bacterium]